MIAAIVAVANTNVIGMRNKLPWYLPADLKHFKELTAGHTVVMGRKTYESIIAQLGWPLPNRRNVVITRDHSYAPAGVTVVHSLEDALLRRKGEKVFVIGGEQIYRQALPLLDRLYVTEVHADVEGDAHFPDIQSGVWAQTTREEFTRDDRNQYDYAFVTYDRRP